MVYWIIFGIIVFFAVVAVFGMVYGEDPEIKK